MACCWLYAVNRCERIETARLLKALIPPFLIALVFLFLSYNILSALQITGERGTFYDPGSNGVEYSLQSAILTPFATWLNSLWLCVWPMDLTIERAFPPVTSWSDPRWMAGAVLMAGVIVGAWMARKTIPAILFGAFWFFITWAPVSGAVPVGYLMADRYLYIPCVGFSIAAVSAVCGVWRRLEDSTKRPVLLKK